MGLWQLLCGRSNAGITSQAVAGLAFWVCLPCFVPSLLRMSYNSFSPAVTLGPWACCAAPACKILASGDAEAGFFLWLSLPELRSDFHAVGLEACWWAVGGLDCV